MNYHFMIHERSLKNGDTITKYIYVDCQTGEECLDSISEKSINDDFQVLKDTLMQSEQFDDPFAQTLSSASRWDELNIIAFIRRLRANSFPKTLM